MGRINCRNPECGFTRSTTVCSTEGEHIPECFGCGDPPYTIPWDEDPEEEVQHTFNIFSINDEEVASGSGATSTSGGSTQPSQ